MPAYQYLGNSKKKRGTQLSYIEQYQVKKMNFRDRIEKNKETQSKPVAANNNEQEESVNYEYFGIENIRNSLTCIDLRFADGTRKALSYSYIMEISFTTSHEIEILSTSKKITITGRYLMRLYNCIVSYRVKYVQENMGTDANEEGLFIKHIKIEDIS